MLPTRLSNWKCEVTRPICMSARPKAPCSHKRGRSLPSPPPPPPRLTITHPNVSFVVSPVLLAIHNFSGPLDRLVSVEACPGLHLLEGRHLASGTNASGNKQKQQAYKAPRPFSAEQAFAVGDLCPIHVTQSVPGLVLPSYKPSTGAWLQSKTMQLHSPRGTSSILRKHPQYHIPRFAPMQRSWAFD